MGTILVIDDDDTVRLSVKLALEDAQHHVVDAADGIAGMALFRQQPTDLVVTDIFMPGKEGLETIDEIKRVRPATKIIAISGGGRVAPDHYLEIAICVGADRSLRKPFDIGTLVAEVNGLLGP
jgi:DNA-binding response OmpR family regulator